MTTVTRNLFLTALAFGLAAYFARLGQPQLAGACLTFVAGLWLHSGRRPPADPVPVAVALLCCLAFGCQPGKFTLLTLGAFERGAGPIFGTAAVTMTDGVEMKPVTPPTCTSGRACLYTSSADNLLYTTDANALTLKLHAASSMRTSANCAGLASPAAGDVCYDTTIPSPRWYTGAGWSSFPTDALVVHLAGAETITGTKTFGGGWLGSGATAFNLSGSTGTFLTPTGAVTIGPGAVGVSGNVTLTTTKTLAAGGNTLIGAVADKLNAAMLAIASQAVGDILYGDSTTTFARLGIGTAGKVLNVNSGATAPQWTYAPITVTGGAATAIGAGATGYLVAPGIAASSATLVRLYMFTTAGTVRNLYCVADTLPGGAETETITVKRQVGGSGALSTTTVTCVIDATGACNDTTHSQANVAGTALVIEAVQSAASVAAGVTCSVGVTP